MTIHKEGYGIITKFFLLLGTLDLIVFFTTEIEILFYLTLAITSILFLLVVSFFRSPNRKAVLGEDLVIAPADGTVVVIEETQEQEYLKDKRIQVSIFMSPLNVHINWYPVKGIIKYCKHHSGRFMAAWLPKSSTENERTTVVIENDSKTPILMRQIAGAMARRIVSYAQKGEKVDQCQQEGFIKFGSRVDVFLPLGTEINVKLNQKVKGSQTVIARLNR